MVVLYSTEQYYPLQAGRATADYNLTYALAQAGHVVYVITTNTYGPLQLKREGGISIVSSGSIRREAIEIAPRLFVIEMDIYDKEGWKGEVALYQDFVHYFECDLFIASGIWAWTSDLTFDLLPVCSAKKKILRSHGEYALMHGGPKGFVQHLKLWAKKILYSPERYRLNAYIPLLRAKLKQCLKDYDRVFFLHKRSHGYAYFEPYCPNIDVLPNGVFEKDICPPKTLPRSYLRPQHTTHNTQSVPNNWGDGPYVLNVSSYYREKGQDAVLEAYYRSEADIPLVFVGFLNAGDTLDSLKTLKTQLDHTYGTREVHFLYQLPREQVLEVFKKATLFLHASHEEGFPMVILESMQFGIPFICTDVGNVRDLCAELIINNPLEMATKINALLGDPDYYNQMSQEMHHTVKEYTYEKIIGKIESVIQD
ncbi:glycosyltransferase family 4 protein [Helicobacter bizzozeronii]|uniref:glycosyltransferase family 4 protein n=1 Tax=Helicobacter bizzozeronii TaxID=56877 RepID=UPI001F348C16|nr:glycosyltransferase family 4 protein [Helicobacter bizzozeronii]